MWQLARIHVQGLGPPDARFDPLTLDLQGPDGPAHSVLWLANGGGKTTLLRLVFHVLRFSEARKIGKELPGSQTALSGLLNPGDVGHVVLEWAWTGAARRLGNEPERLITALVCGLRAGREGGKASDVTRSFYSLGPGSVLGFDEVRSAMVTDGRRTMPVAYLDWLRDQDARRPGVRLTVTETINRWEAHLLDLGVDPALFRYQIEMNQGEGGADGLLSRMREPRDVVAFLLRSVVSPESLHGLDDEVDAFVEKVARRPQLELEQRFIERLRQVLEGLRTAGEAHSVGIGEERRAREAAGALRAALEAAAASRRAEAEQLEAQRAAAVEARSAQDTRRGQALRRAGGLEQWIAGERRSVAVEAARLASEARRTAELEQHAWIMLPQVTEERAVRSRIATLHQLLDQEDEELAPVRAALDDALGRLMSRLDQLVETAERDITEFDRHETRAVKDAAHAQDIRRQAEQERGVALAERERLEARLDERRRRRAELEDQGVLSSKESAPDAVARHTRVATAAREERQTADTDESDADKSETDSVTTARAAERERDHASHTRAALEAAAAEREIEAARLRSDPLLVDIFERPVGPLDVDGDAAVAALEDEAARCDAELAALAVEASADERDLAHVASHGVLAPDDDAKVVVRALQQARIPADYGAEYVRTALPLGDRREALRQRPWLSAAIVVPDRAAALEATQELAGSIRNPVLLTERHADDDMTAVPGHPAAWDRDAAEVWAADAEERQAVRAARRADQQARGQAARKRSVELRALLEAWNPDARAAYQADHAAAVAAGQEAQRRIDAAETAVLDARARRAQAVSRAGAAATAEARAVAAHDALIPLVKLEAVSDELLRAREAVEETQGAAGHRIVEQTKAITLAEAARNEARRLLDGARARAVQYRAVRAPFEGRRARHLVAADHADEGSVEELQGRIADLDGEIARRSSAEALQRSLTDAESALQRLANAIASANPQAVERARELAPGPDAEDPFARRRSQEAADHALGLARNAEAVAAGAEKLAEQRWTAAQGLPDAVAPDPVPTDVAAAEERLRSQREEQEAASSALRDLDAQLRRTEPALITEQQAAERLMDIAGGLEPLLTTPTLDSDTVDRLREPARASEERNAAQARLRAASQRIAETLEARDRAAARLSGVLEDPDYEHVGGQMRRDLLRTDVEQRTERAAELADRLRQRAELISDTLQSLRRDRTTVATTLAKEVDAGIRLLLRVESASRLPDGLGPWTGQRLLRFRGVSRPRDLPAVVAKVEVTLDRLVLSDRRPRGVDLLIHCVTDIVDSPALDVAILKPNAGEPGTPQPVSALPLFSGGQRATVAILIYATLARLRASELHRRGQEAGVGVLLLDNPLGKASAGFLVDQQLLVATANGIQLVYATGVGDFDALDRFPRRIRLRNRGVVGRALRRVVSAADADVLLGNRTSSEGLEAIHHWADLSS
jgi:hypothetical protein